MTPAQPYMAAWFCDENSRSLREFTRELAEASGYILEWDRFGKSLAGRDLRYIARNLSVNALDLPPLHRAGTKRDAMFTVDQFAGNRNLLDLQRDAVRPSRAIAFEQLPEADAIEAFPELAGAYDKLRKGVDDSIVKFSQRIEKRQRFQENVRIEVLERLDTGETEFKSKEPAASRQGNLPTPDRNPAE